MSVLIWNWADIKEAFLTTKQSADVHVEMLERCYPPVPKSYYATVFFSMFGGACVLLTFWPLQLPVWGLALAVVMAAVFLVPIGTIAAITNTTLGLNVITEFVAGYIWPGQPIANVAFKVGPDHSLSSFADADSSSLIPIPTQVFGYMTVRLRALLAHREGLPLTAPLSLAARPISRSLGRPEARAVCEAATKAPVHRPGLWHSSRLDCQPQFDQGHHREQASFPGRHNHRPEWSVERSQARDFHERKCVSALSMILACGS